MDESLAKLQGGMKPMIILPIEEMSKEDIQTLRDNGICVVEAAHPEQVRFMDPIMSAADRPKIEKAAIEMSRLLLNNMWGDYTTAGLIGKKEFAEIFVGCLVNGTPLERRPQVEIEKEIFDDAKHDEIRRLAREEAKTERAKKKSEEAAKAKAEKK